MMIAKEEKKEKRRERKGKKVHNKKRCHAKTREARNPHTFCQKREKKKERKK